MEPTGPNLPPLDPRVPLAAERTLLAWVRTGIALMGFGFVVARFGLFLREVAAMKGGETATHGGSLWVGVGLVTLGAAVLAGAGWRFRRYTTHLAADPNSPPPGAGFAIAVTALLAVVGVGLVVYLLVSG